MLKGGNVEDRKKVLILNPDDWKIEKYPKINGKHYIAYSKDGKYYTNDYMNQAGKLTSYIKTLGIEIPTLYDRRKYYMMNGNYWWEQWFDIKLINDKPVKKCPYCDWETTDLENNSGAFEQHILKAHKIQIDTYLKKYPEDKKFFKSFIKKKERTKKIISVKNHIICPICGRQFSKITETHLKTHGLSMSDFRKKYFDYPILSEQAKEQCHKDLITGNLVVPKNRFVSKPEKEIQSFLKEHNINFEANRQILGGQEIDLLIPSLKIGIEFDGLLWHSEFFGGKKHKYHLNKTIIANNNGYGLIHIFEDEYFFHKNIVYSKLKHLLHLDNELPKIAGRKCTVKEILKKDAENFLNVNHIQGFASSTIYLGCFYNDEMVAVMSFKNGSIKNNGWELNRFATSSKYQYQGVGSKMFSYFVKNYNPENVFSFADRRWTLTADDNLYTKMGFSLENITPPRL